MTQHGRTQLTIAEMSVEVEELEVLGEEGLGDRGGSNSSSSSLCPYKSCERW